MLLSCIIENSIIIIYIYTYKCTYISSILTYRNIILNYVFNVSRYGIYEKYIYVNITIHKFLCFK